MNHNCYNCGHFDAYFSKGYCCFLRTDCGYCGIFNETIQKHFSCEKWIHKHYPRFNRDFFLKELETALTQINGIKLILDDLSEQLDERKS